MCIYVCIYVYAYMYMCIHELRMCVCMGCVSYLSVWYVGFLNKSFGLDLSLVPGANFKVLV